MSNYKNKPIFIVGLPRSGTSMVAGILANCGVWTGRTVRGDKNNPKGFFENIFIREQVIKGMLRSSGCDPLGVTKLPPLDVNWSSNAVAAAFSQVLKHQDYDDKSPWLYKDAKMTLLWPVIHKVYPSATWVIVRRDPKALVKSFLRTSFMSQHSKSSRFWKKFIDEYISRLDALKKSNANYIELDSGEVIAGNYAQLEKLLLSMNLSLNAGKVNQFVSPDLWERKKNT